MKPTSSMRSRSSSFGAFCQSCIYMPTGRVITEGKTHGLKAALKINRPVVVGGTTTVSRVSQEQRVIDT